MKTANSRHRNEKLRTNRSDLKYLSSHNAFRTGDSFPVTVGRLLYWFQIFFSGTQIYTDISFEPSSGGR